MGAAAPGASYSLQGLYFLGAAAMTTSECTRVTSPLSKGILCKIALMHRPRAATLVICR